MNSSDGAILFFVGIAAGWIARDQLLKAKAAKAIKELRP